ncbi:unnamed protein product [Closterium sp. NIES-54]
MVQQVLQRFGFTYSSPQATPLPTRHSLSALPSDESVESSGPYAELVGCLMYLMTCTRPDLAYPLSILARYVAPGRHRPEHMAAAKRVLRYLCSTSGMGLVLGGRSPVVLTGHADASWADDQATQRSSQGYTFSLGSGSVSWRSTRSSSVLGSSCEAEIYAGAMVAQELRWLTYLLTDLGEPPRSPPVLYVDNKAMLALCREQRLEHRTKHIALRYFLARELQQRGQLRLAYVASEANTADVFTKALAPSARGRSSHSTHTPPPPPPLSLPNPLAPPTASSSPLPFLSLPPHLPSLLLSTPGPFSSLQPLLTCPFPSPHSPPTLARLDPPPIRPQPCDFFSLFPARLPAAPPLLLVSVSLPLPALSSPLHFHLLLPSSACPPHCPTQLHHSHPHLHPLPYPLSLSPPHPLFPVQSSPTSLLFPGPHLARNAGKWGRVMGQGHGAGAGAGGRGMGQGHGAGVWSMGQGYGAWGRGMGQGYGAGHSPQVGAPSGAGHSPLVNVRNRGPTLTEVQQGTHHL